MTPPAPTTGSPTNAAISVPALLEQRPEALRVGHADGHDLVDERAAVAGLVGRDAGQRRAPRVHAVVAVLAGDDDPLLRLADDVPVAPDELGRRVDGVRSAGAEEDLASGIGAIAARRSASWRVVSVVYAPNEEYAATVVSCSATAWTMVGRP